MTRQLNIIRFPTQALEVVVEGVACEPTSEGRPILVATVEELNERSLRNELHLAR